MTPSAGPATTATGPKASSVPRLRAWAASISKAAWATSSRRSSGRWPAAAAAGVAARQAGADAEVRHRAWRSRRPSSAAARRSRYACRRPVSRAPAAGPPRAPSPMTCVDCQGTGELRKVRQSLLGQVVTSVACARCSGTGEMIPHPCAGVPRRGAPHRGEHLHRRGAGRRGGRFDLAAGRPRCGRPARRRQRLAVRAPRGDARTSASSATVTTCTRR